MLNEYIKIKKNIKTSLIIKKIKSNFFIIFLRSIRTALGTAITWKKNRKDISLFDLYDFFIIRSIFGLTYFRNKIGYRKTNEAINSNNFKHSIKKNKILGDLNEKGFSYGFSLKNEQKKNLLTEILKNLKSSKIIFKDKSVEEKEIVFVDKNDIDQYLTKNPVHMIKSSINLNKTNLLNKIFMDDFFIKLAKDYLNTDKLTILPYFYISAANNDLVNNNSSNINKLMSISTQEYHFDVDFKKFFKIFVYFSDVLEETNGSHIYIPKTHTQKKMAHIITSRFTTSDIEENYTPKFVFLGEAGTTFIVDTFGIHRGSPVIKDTRLAFILEFGKGHFPVSKNCKYI